MAYQATLNGTQQVTITNQGIQTHIAILTSTPEQQQSQSSSFSTGAWKQPPQLFQSDEPNGIAESEGLASQTQRGFVLQIDGEQTQHFILIQSSGIQTISGMPSLQNAIPIKLETVADPASQTPIDFKPMQPMQPMRMGNMSMDINSMSMQMGDMKLNLGNQPKSSESKTFCSQCGTEAKQGDFFCRSCGHELSK